MGLKFKTGLEKILKYGVTEDQMNSVGLKIQMWTTFTAHDLYVCFLNLLVPGTSDR